MDITINWDAAHSRGDFALVGADLQSGSDLKTAMIVSLFTDRRAADDDDIPDGTHDPRGWWADDPQRPIGSRLWLISRAKQTDETLQRAYDYIAEALRWLVDDGVVQGFDIQVAWQGKGFLAALITAHQPDGRKFQSAFSWAWTGVQ
jgi:phage gp46-like protein